MKKLTSGLSLMALLLTLISSTLTTQVASAAIETTDYFTITAAGSATSMDSGATIEFTINSLDTNAAANELAGSDYAFIEIMDPSTWQPHQNVDITALGGGLSIKQVTTPWGVTTPANLSGTSDNMVAVNVDSSGTGTVTVKATSSFNIFVWAENAAINAPDSGGDWSDGGTPAGQDFREMTVNSATTGADHLTVIAGTASAEVGEVINITINQVNTGEGLVTSALADVGVTLSVDGDGAANITSVNGVPLETPSASIADQSLTNGTISLTAVVSDAGGGTLTISPASATLAGSNVTDTVSVTAASDLTIQGYGPPSGQVGVPNMAPIDFFFSKNPDPNGTVFTSCNNNCLPNTLQSTFSISTSNREVTGNWNLFTETWGGSTNYRVTFEPNEPFTSSTTYDVSVLKSLAPSKGSTDLTDGDTAWTMTFTTGTGGGEWVEGENFSGDMGGEFPPMASLGYPMPGSWDVPTNMNCVIVDFDRPMDASTLNKGNIYVKKVVDGIETGYAAGTHTVTTLNSNNDSVCISGYTYDSNAEYRVIVTRDVTDTAGTQLAGMPIDENGNPIYGGGFGYSNMGPFKESFHTSASGSGTVTSSLMGLNLDKYKVSGTITGVPTGMIVRASFNKALDPSTVNTTNVTLKKNGTVPEPGTIFYDSMANTIEFVPSSPLSAATNYTFGISTGVTSISGTAISAVSQTFTTGAADSTAPQVVFADADNYGIFVQFDEPLAESTTTDRSYYTLKTCSQQAVNANGATCNDSSTPTTISLLSGVNAHYERMENAVWMDGLTLTPGDGFYIEVGNGVTDMAGNGVNASYKSWTGFVDNAGNFDGGQGMFNMDSMGFEDFDMGQMGMMPVGAWPMNSMASATTTYFIDIPITTQIPADGYIVLTFPSGFDVTGAVQDSYSPANSDFNGPNSGTVTFDNTIPSTFTDGAANNDGIGIVAAARKIAIQLSAATQTNDFLHIDISGIQNTSEPKDFTSAGYQVNIKTYSSAGTLLEAMTTMPFFISSAGTNTVSGRVTTSGTGLNGVRVFLDSPMTGPMETTTSQNGAGDLVAGDNTGEFKFENLPTGEFRIFTEPTFSVSGNDYYGQEWPEPIYVSGNVTKNFTVNQANSTNGASQGVILNFSSLPSNLGFNNSIDIFAGGPNGFVVKTISSSTLSSNGTGYEYTLYLPSAGEWFVGLGPALPKGPQSKMPEIDWMPVPPTRVDVTGSTGSWDALTDLSFSLTQADKTITGTVIDGSGNAISNAEIYGYSPQAGLDSHTQANADGTFSLNVVEGTFKVGAFLPGMPNSQEVSVLVEGDSFYVAGSPTASTGSSGANPFTLKVAKPNLTIQGRVSDGTNALTDASVWAHRTDSPSPPINTMVDSSGNYTLYVTAGTWQVEADAHGYGYLGSKTLTVSTSSLTGQNFEVSGSLGSISGSIDVPGTSDDSGVIVYAYGENGGNEAKTDSSGNYKINVPNGDYTVEAFIPGTGDLAPLSITVDGDEAGGTDYTDFTMSTPHSVTISLKDSEASAVTLTEDTFIDFVGTNGKGNGIFIPAGNSSGTSQVIQGEYFLNAYIPGVGFDQLTITGAEFNNVNGTPSTDGKIDIDGTGDNITITIPDLYTVSGQVSNSAGTGVNNAWVSISNSSTKEFFGTMTSNNAAGGGLDGEYTVKVPAGTYVMSSDKPGYSATPTSITVTENSTGNDFTLTANNRTITGTVTDSNGAGISNAFVWAEAAGGGFAGTETSTDGTYVLSVKDAIWNVNAGAEGYSDGTALTVDTTTADKTDKNFSLSTLTGSNTLKKPKTESIVPSAGGTIIDSETNTTVTVPPLALGSSSDAGQITTNETNKVHSTPTADPIGNGQKISANDSDGNPITNLDDDIDFRLRLDLTEMTANGITTTSDVDTINNAYWDDATNNWVSLPTTKTYFAANGSVIDKATVTAAGTLTDANVDHITLRSATDHFTVFASVTSTGDTPPATPTGGSATAGDAQVTLSWTANAEADISSYNIWEANVTEGVASTLSHSSCSATCTKTITGLTNSTAYSYQLIAVDADGDQSAASSAMSVTPVAASSPSEDTGGGGGGGGETAATMKQQLSRWKQRKTYLKMFMQHHIRFPKTE